MKKLSFFILFFLCCNFLFSNDDEYLIQSGDILKIYVWKHPEFDRTVKVNINGDIIYDVIGKNIKAKDLTLNNLIKKIEAELSKIIFEPKVIIDIVEFQKNSIIVLGEGIKEGQYFFAKSITLLEVLKSVGWEYQKNKSTSVRVIKKNAKIDEININEIIEEGKSEKNINFENGDIIYVISKTIETKIDKIKVIITGSVKNPGIYDFNVNTKLITALKTAGWDFIENKKYKILILKEKDKKKIEFFLNDIFDGDLDKNIVLDNEDIIYLSEEMTKKIITQSIQKDTSHITEQILAQPAQIAQPAITQLPSFQPIKKEQSKQKIQIYITGKEIQNAGRFEVAEGYNIMDLLEFIKWRYDENYFTHIEIINFNNKKIINNLEKTIALNSDILKYTLLDNDFILIEKRPALEKINLLIISNLFNTNIYSFNSDVSLFEILNFLKYQYSDTQLTTLTLYRNGELVQSLIIENNFNKLNDEIFFQNNDILFIENFPKYKKINLLAENINEKEFILQINERLIDLIKKINFSINDDFIQIAYIKSKNGENKIVILNDLLNNNNQNININLTDGDFIQIKEYVELPFDSSFIQISKEDIISYEYKFKNIEVEKIIEEIKKYFENKNVFVINNSNNSLIIKDKPLNIKKILPVLQNLDKAVSIKQFKISAQIVEVSFNNEDDFGLSMAEVVDNDNIGKNLFNYNSIDGQIIFRSYPSNIQIILNNLKKKGKVNTLSRPNIVAINKKEAEILVGNQIPFKKAMYDISANNNDNVITSNVSYEFKDVFIKLKVTPDFIFPDKILLNIQPEANSLAGYTTDNQPIINTRKATTNILIKSGETVFIGGIISSNNTEVEQKNKFFEKIPLLNSLFTTKKKSDSRTELIVLLSCEIIE
ncbi:MAG TPA: polysaccharide biosynthesis/export family protein [bacterium]|nr:polysaccharide biosynthesis/export family protein [bacterium]